MEPFEIRGDESGRGLFAREPIARGAVLFGLDDWQDEEERAAFVDLSPEELDALAPQARARFLRFAYNHEPESIRGTFLPERVRHPVNFLNHACDPNVGYDGADRIVALRAIAAGEELRMDYATYSFSFDHPFRCRCGSARCRGQVRRDDWQRLVREGAALPAFMAQAVAALLHADSADR